MARGSTFVLAPTLVPHRPLLLQDPAVRSLIVSPWSPLGCDSVWTFLGSDDIHRTGQVLCRGSRWGSFCSSSHGQTGVLRVVLGRMTEISAILIPQHQGPCCQRDLGCH